MTRVLLLAGLLCGLALACENPRSPIDINNHVRMPPPKKAPIASPTASNPAQAPEGGDAAAAAAAAAAADTATGAESAAQKQAAQAAQQEIQDQAKARLNKLRWQTGEAGKTLPEFTPAKDLSFSAKLDSGAVQLTATGAAASLCSLTYDNKQYSASKATLHTPSQHTVNQYTYDMELQISFRSTSDKTAQPLTLAVFVSREAEKGWLRNQFSRLFPSRNAVPALDAVLPWAKILGGAEENVQLPSSLCETLGLDRPGHLWYAYDGTALGQCPKAGRWLVMAEALTVSAAGFAQLQAIPNKAEPPALQPADARVVTGVAAADEMTSAAKWGSPGLGYNDWVMKGKDTWYNYLLSGKFQPEWLPGGNKPAAKADSMVYEVPKRFLFTPDELVVNNQIKQMLGQYKYEPGPTPKGADREANGKVKHEQGKKYFEPRK